jgi:uncharacterized protein (TIGR02271 family)
MATANRTRTVVVGVFHDRAHAQAAVDELRRMGFGEDQIGVAAREGAGVTDATELDTDTHAGEGAVAGGLAGAGVGGLWAVGIAAGVLPAIGPAIAGGILASILASAATGAVAGGVIGALLGIGVPEDEAKYYDEEFRSGRTIVTVRAENRFDEAQDVLRRHGAYDVNSSGTSGSISASSASAASNAAACATGTGSAATMSTGARTTSTGERTMQLREEELHAHKTPVQTGEVAVHKEVVTEHKTIDVPVMREEVVIERRPASGHSTTSGQIGAGGELRIPVKEEKVNVNKETVVKEEVSIGKRQVHDTEKVSGNVRKEQIRVEKDGDVDVKRK